MQERDILNSDGIQKKKKAKKDKYNRWDILMVSMISTSCFRHYQALNVTMDEECKKVRFNLV